MRKGKLKEVLVDNTVYISEAFIQLMNKYGNTIGKVQAQIFHLMDKSNVFVGTHKAIAKRSSIALNSAQYAMKVIKNAKEEESGLPFIIQISSDSYMVSPNLMLHGDLSEEEEQRLKVKWDELVKGKNNE